MFHSLEEILKECNKEHQFWEVVQKDDCREEGITAEESFDRMRKMYQAMKDSISEYDPELLSASGLVGTEAARLQKRFEDGRMICGDLISRIMIRALKVAESNACMKRIVAAPTAGSCGVLPAVLISLQEYGSYTDDEMVKALYVAGGIGGVIAARASLSGAEGGCQAEIGSASAMAAGAVAFSLGGDPETIMHAGAIALKGLLGLVCDPVAGLVEVPCVKRNVIASVNAVTSADMALSGIKSKIPPDEVIDAMRSIGHSMSEDLRETGKGGLAAVPAAQAIKKKIQGHRSQE